MEYLKIENNGELDIRLVALMGGTTKANDKYKIGQFGTGLKYTFAYLFRNNIDFKIFSGEELINISTEREEIKNQEFEIICINGQRTSITAQMGAEWSAWMIIRELWCNALDEGGYSKNIIRYYKDKESSLVGSKDKTTFYIQLTPDIQNVLDNWKTYFIHDKSPIFENEEYGIYKSDGNLKLYKQGVLIYQAADTQALFNYDIKGASINELREFKGLPSLEIMNALSNTSPDVINYFFANITEKHYEGVDMDYEWYSTFGNVWKEALGAQKIVSWDTARHVEQNGISADQIETAIKLPKNVYKALTKAFEGVGALRMADNKTEFYEAKDIRLEQKTNEVLELLKDSNYIISPELKIIYGTFGKKNLSVAIGYKNKELMISQSCLAMTGVEMASLIIERNEIFITKFEDCSRETQQHFVKLYTSALLINSQTEA